MAAAATPAASDTSAPRDRLNIWEGRWKEVVETKETAYSHAASVPSHLTCAWTADRGYIVCEYLSEKVAPGQDKPSDHLSIFTNNDANKVCKHLGISKDYKTLEEPTIVIEGNLWHYTYELPGDNGQKLELRDSYQFVTNASHASKFPLMAASTGRCYPRQSE